MIEIRNLTKKYEAGTVLRNVNAEIREGDVIAVIGPSGTGKSTFIRCLNLLVRPTEGQVLIDGEDITAKGADVDRLRRRMGMVFQQFNLFEHLTVLENVMIPQMDILGRSRQEAYEKALELLRMVGLEDRILRYPDALSGGQKQRAAIARTLAMDPEIILFDEPTSALDPTLVGEVEYIIEQLAREGRTMVIVTHAMNFARKVANRVFYMDEGGIYEEGTADEIFSHPKREKTRRFIQQTKVLEVCISKGKYDMPEIISSIASFGDMLSLSGKCVNHMQMAVEEICIQTLLPHMKDGQKIRIQAESAEEDEDVRFRIEYDGEKLEILQIMDPLVQKIMGLAADDLREDGNTVFARIRK